MCLSQGHNTMPLVGVKPRTARFGVRRSTTTPPRSLRPSAIIDMNMTCLLQLDKIYLIYIYNGKYVAWVYADIFRGFLLPFQMEDIGFYVELYIPVKNYILTEARGYCTIQH